MYREKPMDALLSEHPNQRFSLQNQQWNATIFLETQHP